MTPSGHVADTHGFTSKEPNLANSQFVVAWADTQNSCGSKRSQSTNFRNICCESNIVRWQEQGRHALNFQQTGFERTAQESLSKQLVMKFMHVAVAQATKMSREEMRRRRRTRKTREVGSMKQRQNFKGIKWQNQEHPQYQQGVRRHMSDVQEEVHVRQIPSGEVVEILRHELSQYLAEGSHCQNLFTTSRYGASESQSEIEQLRQERDQLNVRGRNFEQSAVRSLEAQFVQKRQLRGMLGVERKGSTTSQAEVIRFGSENPQISQNSDWSQEEVAQLQTRSIDSWPHPEPTQYARDEGYLSQELQWLLMEEHQLESAATGGGRVGTHCTTLLERVETRSIGAADDCLSVHQLKNYCVSWRYPDIHTKF